MTKNWKSTKLTYAIATAIIVCLLAIAFLGRPIEVYGSAGISTEYEEKLFDTDEIITIDIQMDEQEWKDLLANATAEEYHACDVVINGEKLENVGIRTKGNTSLSAIAMDPNSNRFSLKLEFDHYVKGQTCFGLDKLILNNNYADATNMKEAIIYDMYQFIGADASLYNYAKISVNGEYWGVYLALEGVEDSFLERNYGTREGELYKPDSMEIGGGDGGGMTMPDMGDFSFDPNNMPDMGNFDPNNMPDMGNFDPNNMPDMSGGGMTMPDMSGGNFDPNNMPDMGNFNFDMSSMPDMGDFDFSDMGGFSMGGGGANLNYTDDNLDSYSTIWDGSVTKTGDADHSRVVTALKHISEGTDLETYLDVDNVLRYMAVHVFSVNMDSLSGSMAHNYYLYESDGQLNMLPWDYNLSFGGMSMGTSSDATAMVNDAIDTPFSATKFFDALLSDETYLARYHEYLQQLVEEYVSSGRFDETYNRIRSQIDKLVEKDPTAFYTYEEYQNAAEILYETIKLRAQSIEGQLDGSIPSTDAGQRQDSSSLIDASHIDVTAMGEFNMGGGFSSGGMGGGNFGDFSGGFSGNFSGDFSFGNPSGSSQMPSVGSAKKNVDPEKLILYIGCGSAAAVIIALVVVFLVLKRKNKE